MIPDLAAAARGPSGQFLPVRQVSASYVGELGERRATHAPRSRPTSATTTSGALQSQERRDREERMDPTSSISRARSRSPLRVTRHQIQTDLRQVLDARRPVRAESPEIQIVHEVPGAYRRPDVLSPPYRRPLRNVMFGGGGRFTLEGGSSTSTSDEMNTVPHLSREEEARIREEDWEPPVPANLIPVVTGISRSTKRRKPMRDYDDQWN